MFDGFPAPAPVRTQEKPGVLFIVEKSAAMRRVLHLMLSAPGRMVRTFASAGECLSAAMLQHPTCILSDLYTSDMNAVEFRRALLRSGVTSPMVILTNYADSPLTAAVKALGVGEVLEQPCDAERLKAAITRASGAATAWTTESLAAG